MLALLLVITLFAFCCYYTSQHVEVSPMCDRDIVNVPTMQMGFIQFVVAPLFIGRHMRYSFDIAKTLSSNYTR
jgi:3'5'-cyclic nucleotide phosphodiesterase